MGMVAGIIVPSSYEGFEFMITFFPAIVFIIYSAIIMIILEILKPHNIYMKSAKAGILMLVIYLVAQFLSYDLIFRRFYLY